MSFLYCLRTYHSRQNITVITLAGQTIPQSTDLVGVLLQCYNLRLYKYPFRGTTTTTIANHNRPG